MTSAQPTKLTTYKLTKMMNDSAIKEYQKTEVQKKTEQRILYVLSFVNKKEVKKFKRDYINFIARYIPKTKQSLLIKITYSVRCYFDDMIRLLNDIMNKINVMNDINHFYDYNDRMYLFGRIELILSYYIKIRDIMINHISKYRSVARGRWVKQDIIQRNLSKLHNVIYNHNYSKITNICYKLYEKMYRFKEEFTQILIDTEENRRRAYEERLKNKAYMMGNRFEKMILKGLFLNLVSPIWNTCGNNKPDKETLKTMYEHTEEIYEKKYKDVQDIKNILVNPSSELTDYEILYQVYLKNI